VSAQDPAAGKFMTAVRRGHLRELGAPTLLGAIVLLFSAAMLLTVNMADLRDNLAWAQYAEDVMLQTSAVEAGIVGDELTVRSYALTGDKRFLHYQKLERGRIVAAVGKLGVLVASHPADAHRFAAIRKLVLAHMDLYGGLTGMGPGRAEDVAHAIEQDKNRQIMMQTRGDLAAFRVDHIDNLARRQEAIASQLSSASMLVMGIVLAAFLLGGIGLMVSRR
jgi:CHASE3 domain sensor protein